jgi:pimeloyl-ACP methyl ester carboxylesterase
LRKADCGIGGRPSLLEYKNRFREVIRVAELRKGLEIKLSTRGNSAIRKFPTIRVSSKFFAISKSAIRISQFLFTVLRKPDPAKPLVAEWHWATPGEHGQRLFVFLPGRRDRAFDFDRRGFITLAQRRIPGLDCVAVDATLGYYVNGSLAERLQREIIDPARALGYREIWFVGVSMGGLGAFFHERAYPGEVNGLILLAPFLGDDRKLFAEIDAAGGAVTWAGSQPAPAEKPKKSEYQRELWRFLGRLALDQVPQLQIWIAYGDADRLLPGIERLRSVIPPERVFRLKGGHTWEVWTTGFNVILAKIDWKGTASPEKTHSE